MKGKKLKEKKSRARSIGKNHSTFAFSIKTRTLCVCMIRRLPYQFFIPPLLSGFLPPYSNGAKELLFGAKAASRKQRRVDKRAKWSAGARQKRRKKLAAKKTERGERSCERTS
ncbi:hypothetical protein NPIL_493841 [Nephila pilipes]|uniref:Uncharacterized protein n=1 Tax=Nephila pilipes TaxID=299642 RepID=A0A8X6UCQ7_NEPPI|nr:hypothetical protein NPIL_493841 [Nephila pilipes]